MTVKSRILASVRALTRGDAHRHRTSPIPAISASDLQDFHRFFPRSKFFILGHARSGTTLLMRLVRLHPEVHCDYQAHFFTRRPLLKSLVDSPEVEEWLRRKSNRWNHGQDLSPVVLRAAAEFILERDAARLGKRIVGDKSPSSGIHGQSVRDLHDLFPDARVIYIVRDGRDVAISERFRNFIEDSRFLSRRDRQILDKLRREPAAFTSGSDSLFSEEMLRRIARGWATNVREVDSEARRLFRRNYLSVRYEDLLEKPVREMERVWKFLGAKPAARGLIARVRAEMNSNPDEVWQSSRGKDLSTFLAKGRTGNWRTLFTPRDRELFAASSADALQYWKYERTTDW
ncbi:MAG TPA: sulfotransferase [Anaerolineales bacterium]|nr:sulfotransferase [Anaerolineales bacterium]